MRSNAAEPDHVQHIDIRSSTTDGDPLKSMCDHTLILDEITRIIITGNIPPFTTANQLVPRYHALCPTQMYKLKDYKHCYHTSCYHATHCKCSSHLMCVFKQSTANKPLKDEHRQRASTLQGLTSVLHLMMSPLPDTVNMVSENRALHLLHCEHGV